MECKACGAQIADNSSQCPYCQAAVSTAASAPTMQAPPAPYQGSVGSSNKVPAGLCGIFLGAFGVHKFVLGNNKAGAIMLCITVFTCFYGGLIMGPIGFIEGIIYLTKSDEEFHRLYVQCKMEWF